jgi:hypothetical protein
MSSFDLKRIFIPKPRRTAPTMKASPRLSDVRYAFDASIGEEQRSEVGDSALTTGVES